MTISVDAGSISSRKKGSKLGTYRVALNTLERLTKKESGIKFLFYTLDNLPNEVLGKFGGNVEIVKVRPVKFWHTIGLSIRLLIDKPDLFLSFSQSLPLVVPSPSIVYIHDLAFELYPEFYKNERQKLSLQTKHAAKNATKIVSVSGKTKDDLISLYSVSDKKISVIHSGVSERFCPHVVGSEKILKKYGISKDYFLYVGGFKKIKNINGIIKGYLYFERRAKKSCNLVMIGPDLGEYQDVKKLVKDLKLKDKVFLYDFIEDKHLPAVYSEAIAFVSPSFYEGFGLTHLEAMASDLPVIGSTRGSIPEIVGNAGILVDPESYEKIGEAMINIYSDEKKRTLLKRNAYKRAKKFSPDSSVGKLSKLIEKVVK